MKKIISFFICLFAVTVVWGDDVVLVNGDKISGTILGFENSDLILESSQIGKILIPLINIERTVCQSQEITGKKYAILIDDQRKLQGEFIEISNRTMRIKVPADFEVEIPLDTIKRIGSISEYRETVVENKKPVPRVVKVEVKEPDPIPIKKTTKLPPKQNLKPRPTASRPAGPQMLFVINAGLSFATGGIGGNIELGFGKFSVLGGVGIWPVSMDEEWQEYDAETVIGWNLGTKFYFLGYRATPYIGLLFGKLMHVEEYTIDWKNVQGEHRVQDFNGFTFLVGFRGVVAKRLILTAGAGAGYAIGEMSGWLADYSRIQLAFDFSVGVNLAPLR